MLNLAASVSEVNKENTGTASTNFVVVSYFHLWTQLPHHLSRFLFFVLTFSGHNIMCNCLEKQIFEEKRLHLSFFFFFQRSTFVLRRDG